MFSGGLGMWRGIGLRRVYVGEFAGSRSVDRPQKRWIDTMKMFKEEVWMSGNQKEWCRIGVNVGGFVR